ncbi:hypothetical protein D3C86_446230 [compost metagenome]
MVPKMQHWQSLASINSIILNLQLLKQQNKEGVIFDTLFVQLSYKCFKTVLDSLIFNFSSIKLKLVRPLIKLLSPVFKFSMLFGGAHNNEPKVFGVFRRRK